MNSHAQDRARMLAQLATDGPSTAAHIHHALGTETVDGTTFDLEILARAELVTRTIPVGGVFTRRGWRGVPLWDLTDAGRLEASGGAQLTIAPRPPIATQPALF